MVLVRGVNVYPTAIDELLGSIPAVAEYQVELEHEDAMAEMRLRVELSAECGDGETLVRQIETRLRSRFHLRVPVSLCPPGTLPRLEMKARRFVMGETLTRRFCTYNSWSVVSSQQTIANH